MERALQGGEGRGERLPLRSRGHEVYEVCQPIFPSSFPSRKRAGRSSFPHLIQDKDGEVVAVLPLTGSLSPAFRRYAVDAKER